MSLNDKAREALERELSRAFPERAANDPGHARLADALSDTAHTGGDWVACSYKGGQVFRVECKSTGNDCEPIATCSGPDCRANARLIAAAPELLEACKELLRICLVDEGYQPYNPKMRQARTAIARAEGGAR